MNEKSVHVGLVGVGRERHISTIAEMINNKDIQVQIDSEIEIKPSEHLKEMFKDITILTKGPDYL